MTLLAEIGTNSGLVVWSAALLIAILFLVGVLGGLIGLALGTIRLPAMVLLGAPPPAAASANILVSTLSAVAGSFRHVRDGRVMPLLMLVVGLPAFAGGFYSGRAPADALTAVAGSIILWQGIEMALLARRKMRPADRARSQSDDLVGAAGIFTPARLPLGGGIGLGIGLLGGSIGLLLGSIRLPLMIRVLRVDPRVAAGSNLGMGTLGWIDHLLYDRPDVLLFLILGVPAFVGSYLVARLTGRISADRLILVMGALLTASGMMMLWRAGSAVW